MNKYKKNLKEYEKISAEDRYSDKFFNLLYEASQKGIAWNSPNVFQRSYGQKSYSSEKEYKGANAFVLGLTAIIEGFESNYWLTKKQMDDIGEEQNKHPHIRRGEHGTPVFLWKPVLKKDKETGEVIVDESGEEEKFFFFNSWTVFNTEQIDWDGCTIKESKSCPNNLPTYDVESFEAVDDFLTSNYKEGAPKVWHDKKSANNCYYPAFDAISLYPNATFKNVEEYFITFAHELVHSTGHEKRLNRKSSCNKNTQSYANEELVAETGATWLAGLAGILSSYDNSGAYLGSWLTRFKDKKKQLYQAFQSSLKAVNWILGK